MSVTKLVNTNSWASKVSASAQIEPLNLRAMSIYFLNTDIDSTIILIYHHHVLNPVSYLVLKLPGIKLTLHTCAAAQSHELYIPGGNFVY